MGPALNDPPHPRQPMGPAPFVSHDPPPELGPAHRAPGLPRPPPIPSLLTSPSVPFASSPRQPSLSWKVRPPVHSPCQAGCSVFVLIPHTLEEYWTESRKGVRSDRATGAGPRNFILPPNPCHLSRKGPISTEISRAIAPQSVTWQTYPSPHSHPGV